MLVEKSECLVNVRYGRRQNCGSFTSLVMYVAICQVISVPNLWWAVEAYIHHLKSTGAACCRVTYNGYGFVQVEVFENRQPVTEAKFINKSSLFILLPGVIRRLGTEAD